MPDKILAIKKDASRADLEGFAGVLVEAGAINRDDLALVKQKYSTIRDAVDGLILTGVDRKKIAKAYSQFSNIPYVDLESVDPNVDSVIDNAVAKKFGFVPFYYDESQKVLQAAFFDIGKLIDLDRDAIQRLQDKFNIKFEFFITSDHVSSIKQVDNVKQDEEKTKGQVDISDMKIAEDVLRKMPYDLADKFKAVIYQKTGDRKYNLAAQNPSDQKLKDLVDFVEKNGNIKLEVHQSPADQIEKVLERYASIVDPGTKEEEKKEEAEPVQKVEPEVKDEKLSSEAKQVSGYENEDLSQFLGKEKITVEDIKVYANSGRIPELVASLVLLASNERASDIHIEPFEKAVRVRFRIDGELGDVVLLPSNMSSSLVARVKILSKLKLDEQRIPQDGRFDVKAGAQIVDIRVSTLPTVFGEKVVMRLLTKNKEMERLEDLGIEGLAYDRIIEAISKPNGVLLSTGPTGSGKTTSLYSILTRLNKPQVNIITLEDPVEYELPGINQVQVKPQIGFGFADGLRSVLRQDPNIIMVGEIRDGETAELVTHAALTGHLVLSTLHTNDSAGALPRLFNLKVEPFLLTSAINAVIAQRLVRKICQKCREEIEVPQSVMFEVKKELSKLNLTTPLKFYRGKGCENCKNGFSGRVGIFEVLTMTSEIETLVLNKKSADEIFKSAVRSGMVTMRQDGFIKVIKGITTVDEVLRVTSESKEG